MALDYLRGLMAVAVMIYHFVSWSVGAPSGGELLGKLGVYAVPVFYILSGLSLVLAYAGRVLTTHDVAAYAIKRVFRILPLFWLATTGSLLLDIVQSIANGSIHRIEWGRLVANYTLTFGFIAPDGAYATGGWSIGNEAVFYVLFPSALLLLDRGRAGRSLLVGGGIAATLLFAYVALVPAVPLASQWGTYVHPLNQIPFFLAGMLIATKGIDRSRKSRRWLWIVASAFAAFWAIPASGDKIGIVTGATRIVLSGVVVLLVAATYASGLELRGRVHRALTFLGETSYSIYLLHPLVSFPIAHVGRAVGLAGGQMLWLHLLASVPLTLIASWMSYRLVERPGIHVGRRLADRLRPSVGPVRTEPTAGL